MEKFDLSNLKLRIILIALFAGFILISYLINYNAGINISLNFFSFFKEVIIVLPAIFIFIGLFDVWIKRATIESHLGIKSKFAAEGYFWAILLSTLNVGGMLLSFPMAYSLYKKNARLSVVLTYLCASGLLRINMIVFEITSLGLKFTIIRILTAIPLVIISSIIIEKKFNIVVLTNE